jgi:predicted outer membrane protein
MSTQHDMEPTTDTVVPTRSGLPGMPGQQRTWLLAAGIAVVVAGGAAVAAVTGTSGDGGPDGPVTAAVSVPDKVAGLEAADSAQDFAQDVSWQAKAKAAVGDATVVGRQYGSAKERKTIRVVAARTDLTGKLELAWAADQGTEHGDARCTQNFRFTESGKVAVRPTMLMCWRTSATFSAYTIVIDFDEAPKPAAAVAAIDDIWGTA